MNEDRCGKCGKVFSREYTVPERKPCPYCGSMARSFIREFTESISFGVSDSVYTSLTTRQKSIIDKVSKAFKDEFAKAEIESVTLGFPQLISIKITKKKKEKS